MASITQPNRAHDIPRAERIARLNDELRIKGRGGRVVMTQGVQALVGGEAAELLRALAAFDDFDADSDPHGERDFGLIDFAGCELIWKIDYLAPDLLFGSNDPADASATQRVLTVLLAEEY